MKSNGLSSTKPLLAWKKWLFIVILYIKEQNNKNKDMRDTGHKHAQDILFHLYGGLCSHSLKNTLAAFS